MQSLYRRPLPEQQIPFSSAEGRQLFREALADGTMEGFFPLVEQFHTQADPSFCGLGSLVMALNALGIDPGRLWRGPWRWFSEELLDCCTPLEAVQRVGVSLEELACLARCNGASAELVRADSAPPSALATAVEQALRSPARSVVVASYSRSSLGQSGGGHFSPIGGYHAQRELVLLLDVARFKYPPHWLPLQTLHAAMRPIDPVTGRARGWLLLERRGTPSSLAYFFSCADGLRIGDTILAILQRTALEFRTGAFRTRADVLRMLAAVARDGGLSQCFRLRTPATPEHERSFERLQGALRSSAAFVAVESEAGSQDAELVTGWLLAAPAELWKSLSEPLAHELAQLSDLTGLGEELTAEVRHLRSQVQFLLEHARDSTRAAAQ